MPLKLGYQQLIADAMSKIETLNQAEAQALLDDPDTLFVDIRDVRELEREGMIPGAFHAPRGMLEFWVDPDSPYYKPELGSGKRLVLYCGSAWRSALAAEILGRMACPRFATLKAVFRPGKKQVYLWLKSPARHLPPNVGLGAKTDRYDAFFRSPLKNSVPPHF
jgi:rhodanese-related sulfurtransferase